MAFCPNNRKRDDRRTLRGIFDSQFNGFSNNVHRCRSNDINRIIHNTPAQSALWVCGHCESRSSSGREYHVNKSDDQLAIG
jgi:hypothetical protein